MMTKVTVSKKIIVTFFLTVLFLLNVNCSKQNFGVADPTIDKQSQITNQFYPLQASKESFTQATFDKNQVNAFFSVNDRLGFSVAGLQNKDFMPFENDRPITKFSISSSENSIGQKADVIFVVDITSSMSPTINTVKQNVSSFVEKLKKKKIDVNLCLVTFKDSTFKKCTGFVNDNPATPDNENLNTFLSDLSKLDAQEGGDMDENQLAALIDAATGTPWREGAQRLAVLITDAGFHYSPGNAGDAGAAAPNYNDVIKSVSDNQMFIFSLAPILPGYSDRFSSSQPALKDIVGGQFFDYKKFSNNEISMDSIFDSIQNQISTRYVLKYVLEDNLLNPNIPINQRKVSLRMINSSLSYRIKIDSITSSYPDGKPLGKRSWKIDKRILQAKKLRVLVNGVVVNGFKIKEDQIEFDEIPVSGGLIEIQYTTGLIRDAIVLGSINLGKNVRSEFVRIQLNEKDFNLAELKVSKTLEGDTIVEIPDRFLDESDPLNIVRFGGIKVLISVLK